MPMTCGDLSPGNTLDVNFDDVTVGGTALTGATCTATVYSGAVTWVNGAPTGTIVTNGGPITGTDNGGGSYTAVIPSNVAITVGASYTIVGIISKDGNKAAWQEVKSAKARKGGAGC